jgi:RNA polymerase sigma factor (sigma-70 family)
MNAENVKYYENAKAVRDGCKKLTKRELEIIRLSGKGMTQAEIGAQLNISPRTISAHNYKAYRKINARNVIEAINHVNKFYGR